MLVSPKWQTMWLESQHCSKNIVNMHLPTQQTQKVLEDLKTSCCSPNKAVQLEALKCWGIWINNHSADDWKVNTVCFTAVRPLISKKLQPLYKDVDICKMKLSLMWALLVKVQNIMHLEGPQYILEVFLQSCLTWLSCINGDGCENEVSILMFQLLLGIFNKNEIVSGCDNVIFPPLTTDILLPNKVFHHFADKLLNIFIHWRKVRDKKVIIKLWKHFLENCELSCEHIPIPVWHKIFKLAGQICSERDESVKERLSFLHSCATTLKSALSSSKFIDFGNLLTTPCEALFKKLVELCRVEYNECCDLEMFTHSKEICQVLSNRSVAVGGFDLCINVLDVLEEFSLRSLFWGVWCGLVYCYKVHLLNTDKSKFTKIQMKFFRKLRGVVANFELDRNNLLEDCITEVEEHIDVLNISCLCTFRSKKRNTTVEDSSRKEDTLERMNVDGENQPLYYLSTVNPSLKKILPVVGVTGTITATPICGKFLPVCHFKRTKLPRKTVTLKFSLIKNILDYIGTNSTQLLFSSLFSFRFINLQSAPPKSLTLPSSKNFSFWLKTEDQDKNLKSFSLPSIKEAPESFKCSPAKKNKVMVYVKDSEDEIISTPSTRSRKKAEEDKKKEMENQRRKKRKSFEVIVQEIVRKNKERKTEKNKNGRRSPVSLRSRRQKKKKKKGGKKPEQTDKKENQKKFFNKENKKNLVEVCERKLRNCKKEKPSNQKKIEKKNDGKLENYFKIITKKSGIEVKKEDKKTKKEKKTKRKTGVETNCCNSEKEEGERKGEIAWRQTSLKTMMNKKSRGEKVKQGLRSRIKTSDVTEEKPKIKRYSKKVTESPLAKFSPYKEVFHDHEYAKMEPQEFQTFERVLLTKKETKTDERKTLKKYKKPEKKVGIQETKAKHEKSNASEPVIPKSKELEKPFIETEGKTLPVAENPVLREEEKKMEREIPENSVTSENVKDLLIVKPEESTPVCEIIDLHPTTNDVSCQETPDEYTEIASTPTRRSKKRLKMLDSIKPSKKMKLDDEEKLPLEITEKENLEEKETELNFLTKKEKNGGLIKNDGSPNGMTGMISSRALRMIALVPESTKSSQMQWESPSRVEILKCKKAPNVDKNSRASKMLALLSENVVEVEEVDDFKAEDVNCSKGSVITPNMKAPISSMKSPNSVKKRRSIRFDDTKNETVLYQTDTPPSQILEEKEKCRRINPAEIILSLP